MDTRKLAAAAVCGLLLVPTALAASSDGDVPLVPLDGSIPPFVATARDLGPADPAERLELLVALRLADEPALAAIVASDAPPLSREEVVARFSPALETVESVGAWLDPRGLSLAGISDDRTLLRVNTTVAAAQAAFGVELRMYDIGEDAIRSHATPPMVPLSLAPHIQGIIGLTDAPLTTHHIVKGEDDGQLSAMDNGAPPFSPFDLRNAYDVNPVLAAGFDGAGVVAAITSWGSASQTSLNEYSSAYGLPTATITHVDSNGGSSCGGVDLEWDMDVQLEHAMAPAAALRVYCGSAANIGAMMQAIDRVNAQNVADVVSQSWGTCDAFVDSGTASSMETKLLQASAQGIAFFTSSGDGGSRECTRLNGDTTISPGWPATAPHTTSVAGTRLTMSGASWSGETTWNSCAPCSGAWSASGGGPSLLYAKPSWQTAPAGATKRGSGDVSAVADPNTGVRVRNGGSWWQVGGTSASSPLVAGMWADMVDRHGRMGNAGEKIWPLAGDASVLRDVTTGNNGDFAAGPGYDHPTGLGTPRADALLNALTDIPAPGNLTAVGGGEEVTLGWDAPPGTITGYRVYAGTSAASITLRATLGATTSYVDSGLANETTYYYRVSALNGTREGALTSIASARTFGGPTPPLHLGAVSEPGRITLSWDAPLADGGAPILAYRVYGADTNATGAPARLLGGERWVFQMDQDDQNVPTSGKTRDSAGSFHADVVGPSPVASLFGDGLRFQGVNHRVTIPESGFAIPQGALTMWVRPDGLGTDGLNRLVFKQRPGVSNDLSVYLAGGGNIVHFQLHHTKSTLIGTTDLPIGEWSHVAVTWGPAGQRIYVNGVLEATNGETSGVGTSYTTTMLGNSPNDITRVGSRLAMDEVREYTTQLGAAAIRGLFLAPYAGGATTHPLLAETMGTSYVDTTYAPNVPRAYYVTATNLYGESDASVPATGLVLQLAPDAPTAFGLAPAARGAITLSWSAPAEIPVPISGYRIHRGTTTWGLQPLADVAASNVSFVDTGLPDNASRSYQVQVLTGNGPSNATFVETARTWTNPVTAPENVTATRGPGIGEIGLAWSPPVNDGGGPITAYRIYSGPVGGTLSLRATVGATTSYVDTGLAPGTTRAYVVRALNAVGEGPASLPSVATSFPAPSAPRDPLAVAGPAVGEIRLTWTEPADDGGFPPHSYRVFAGPSTSSLSLVATVQMREYDDTGLPENATRFYRVSAVSDVGEGPQSVAASASTFARPGRPTITTTSGPDAGSITLSWNEPPTGGAPILEYRIYAASTANAAKSLVGTTTQRSFRETGLNEGQLRYYNVSGVNVVGEGAQSLSKQGTAPRRAGPPGGLSAAMNLGARTTDLTWTAPSNAASAGVYGYRIYRGPENGARDLLAEVGDVRTYSDGTCPMVPRCSYHVVAVGIIGEGPASNSATAGGTSPAAGLAGARSSDAAELARLDGHERLVLQLDADDGLVPGLTRDASPFQNHALTGALSPAEGRHGQGLRFHGDDVLTASDDAATSGLAAGTFMAWIKLDEAGDLVLKSDGVNRIDLRVSVGDDGSVRFRTGGALVLATAPGAVPLGEWTHVSATWGSAGKRIYVDGALVASNGDTGSVGTATTTSTNFGVGLLGVLDEIRIYDVALPGGLIDSIAAKPYSRAA